jgi:hypothetical protein
MHRVNVQHEQKLPEMFNTLIYIFLEKWGDDAQFLYARGNS